MHIKLSDDIRSFKKSIDNGGIYFEFSDGTTIAMYRTLYTCEVKDSEGNKIDTYRNFVDNICNSKDRKLIKFYYKVENLSDSGSDNQNIWVDMLKIINNTTQNIYNYAFNHRNETSFQVDVKNLKAVRYTDKNFKVYNIDHYDGKIFDNTLICRNIKLNTRDKRYMNVSRINLTDPACIKEYLKDDIKLEIKDTDETFENTLLWVNGRFVETTKDDNSNKIVYIAKGVPSLMYQHIGFIGTEPLPIKHIDSGFRVASYEVGENRKFYGPDFDINIFKWKEVKISDWLRPYSRSYDALNYSDGEGYSAVIDYLREVVFSENIPESHLIIHNGVVLDRDDYSVVGNKIILKSIRNTACSVLSSVLEEYGKNSTTPFIVESYLPKFEDFRLIIFSCTDDRKSIKINRSQVCYRNYPYPYHITFPKLNVADMVLLDGIYERYLIHGPNMIRYPYTDYMARYSDRNLLNETKVERIWFTYDF